MMFSLLPFNFMFLFLVVFGTLFSISSYHWLGIWAGFEINLIGFLPMMLHRKSLLESESAVKYFVIQALGSTLLIFGSLWGYSSSFTWELADYCDKGLHFEKILIVSGLLMKMGAFPFHFWVPSVMGGVSWLMCFLLSTWQKVAGLFILFSFLSLSFSSMKAGNVDYPSWGSVWSSAPSILFVGSHAKAVAVLLLFSGIGSVFIGGFGGVNQTQLRALFAYSSIGHMGWMTFAIFLGVGEVLFTYFCIYTVVSLNIFLCLWVINWKVTGELSSFLSESGLMPAGIMMMLLSLGGLPPLLGFVGKWFVFLEVAGSPGLIIVILVALIIGSLISLFYYLSLSFLVLLRTLSTFDNSSFCLKEGVMTYLVVSVGVVINLMGGLWLILFF